VKAWWIVLGLLVIAVGVLTLLGCGGGGGGGGGTPPPVLGALAVLAYNDLGMHCDNRDFSEIMVLPPFNNLRAQVIRRTGPRPQLVTSGISVRFSIPGNTRSADKTNFWDFVVALFGRAVPPNVGLTGTRMAGAMVPTAANDWLAEGIPITPLTDSGRFDPYQLGRVIVREGGTDVAQTRAVVPVNWEMNCNLCHTSPGQTVDTNILAAHDRLHGTNLQSAKPVACGSCHSQPPLEPLGLVSDDPDNPSLSRAMHHAHAPRMASAGLAIECYACHPSVQHPCQRDVHSSEGRQCRHCHGNMTAVADPTRRPWVDEPRCSNCHRVKPDFALEQPGTLFRDSVGHGNVHCEACHGPTHAIGPATIAADNVQAIMWQGEAGPIEKCSVCHASRPPGEFRHRAP
jgi:hypothetical protein